MFDSPFGQEGKYLVNICIASQCSLTYRLVRTRGKCLVDVQKQILFLLKISYGSNLSKPKLIAGDL